MATLIQQMGHVVISSPDLDFDPRGRLGENSIEMARVATDASYLVPSIEFEH